MCHARKQNVDILIVRIVGVHFVFHSGATGFLSHCGAWSCGGANDGADDNLSANHTKMRRMKNKPARLIREGRSEENDQV